MFVSPRRLSSLLSIGLLLIIMVIVGFGARPTAIADSPLAAPAVPSAIAAPTEATLHNPTFDNDTWYFFHERHGYGRNLQPDSLAPDDDTANGPQQWWLWFYDGTVPLLTWATKEVHQGDVNQGDRAVKGRVYWDGRHQAGVYQMIYNATPCLTYEFQMYGKAKLGQAGDVLHDLRVGIDRRGYRPDTWAVHAFPSTMEWGASHTEYVGYYGLLTATAEALDSTISAFTYADADGGVSAEILWDTGSFQEVTPPDLISNPDFPPGDASGISSGPTVGASSTSATINWTTSVPALGQVYYRLTAATSTPVTPTATLVFTAYLPHLNSVPTPWLSTQLDKSPKIAHSAVIGGLQPGSTYEYLVASRGVLGEACVTWASTRREFTTAPIQ
jgi:hypothetical protein